MHCSYRLDPEVHRLHPCKIQEDLRRETKRKEIVVYRHHVFGNFVVALYDGTHLLDIGMLGNGDGQCNNAAPWISKDNFWQIVNDLFHLIDKTEVRKQLKAKVKKEILGDHEQQLEYENGIKAAHHWLRRKYGPLKALQWAKQAPAGMQLCEGKDPWR